MCLSLMASCCEDDILVCVCPFVMENIFHANWQWRDAAIMSLGMHSCPHASNARLRVGLAVFS